MSKLIIGTLMILAGIGTLLALGEVSKVVTFTEGAVFAAAITGFTCVALMGTGGAIVAVSLKERSTEKARRLEEASWDDYVESRWLEGHRIHVPVEDRETYNPEG